MLQSYEEHHVADVLCTELAGMPAGAERFDAKASASWPDQAAVSSLIG
jgi:hypothetical protein